MKRGPENVCPMCDAGDPTSVVTACRCEENGQGYQPKTGQRCGCRPGVWRDNCPTCEGTGWVVDFAAIRARHNH